MNFNLVILLLAVIMFIYLVYKGLIHNKLYNGIINNNAIRNTIHDSVTNEEKNAGQCMKSYKTDHNQKKVKGKIVEGMFEGTLNSSLHEGTRYSFIDNSSDEQHLGTDIESMDGSIGGSDLTTENANLKLLAKYLTLLLRKTEAEKELYTIETGKRQVYNSPTLAQLNKKITEFKQTIRGNPDALKYFNENLDITL